MKISSISRSRNPARTVFPVEMCEIETRIVFVFEKYERKEEEFDTKRVSFFFFFPSPVDIEAI